MPKFEKLTDRDHNLISSESGQDTSAYQISGHSLHAFSGKCPETSPVGRTDGRMDGHAAQRSRLVGWTNGLMHRWKEGISGVGWMDGQAENIMPPAPKGGGIKIVTEPFSLANRNLLRISAICDYHQTSNISRTLVGNHSDVVEASPVDAAPTTSSFST